MYKLRLHYNTKTSGSVQDCRPGANVCPCLDQILSTVADEAGVVRPAAGAVAGMRALRGASALRWPGTRLHLRPRRSPATALPPRRRHSATTGDWLGALAESEGSRYSVSVRPEDYSMIIYPGEGGVDHDSLLLNVEHTAFVIASLMNPDR